MKAQDSFTLILDARMHRHSGIGTFIRNLAPLVAELLPQTKWQALLPDSKRPDWLPPAFENVCCDAPIYSIREQVTLSRVVPKNADLFWAPHYNIPWKLSCPLVSTVHDLNHLALSPSLLRNPPRFLYPRIMFGRLSRQARKILCVSQFTRDEFLNAYPFTQEKLSFVHNGVDDFWFGTSSPANSHPNPKPYLLYIGTVRPHKNLKNLLLAFSQRTHPETLDLIIAGPHGNFLTTDPETLALARKLAPHVHVTGELPKERLRDLVQNAQALVLPSFYEGFGLPLLEAFASGCAVICSDLPPFREIAGNLALYFDPHSIPDILQKLEMFRQTVPDFSADSKRLRLERARQFTWKETANVYADTFRNILNHS